MPPKHNPLNLNPLQLRTLTLLQQLARIPGNAAAPDGEGAILVGNASPAHGDHFHLGDAVVRAADATGLQNPAAWLALQRKGLIVSRFPDAALLTPAGLAYDTGPAQAILHRTDHAGH